MLELKDTPGNHPLNACELKGEESQNHKLFFEGRNQDQYDLDVDCWALADDFDFFG